MLFHLAVGDLFVKFLLRKNFFRVQNSPRKNQVISVSIITYRRRTLQFESLVVKRVKNERDWLDVLRSLRFPMTGG